MNLRKEDGFSLTELMVVMTIIAILIGIAGVSYQSSQDNSKDSLVKANLEKSANSLNRFLINFNATPDSLAPAFTLDQLVTQVNEFEKELTLTKTPSISTVQAATYINSEQIYLVENESSLLNRTFVLAAKSQSGKVYKITISRSGIGDPVIA
jgi:prepilin-type N-terminal cleavage/methylation domain-containing protein